MASREKSNVPISKKNFKNALAKGGYNVSSLSRVLEKKGSIKQRSLQRNLQDETMNILVLNEICSIIKVSPNYIRSDIPKKKYEKDFAEKHNIPIDDEGFRMDPYSRYKEEKILEEEFRKISDWEEQLCGLLCSYLEDGMTNDDTGVSVQMDEDSIRKNLYYFKTYIDEAVFAAALSIKDNDDNRQKYLKKQEEMFIDNSEWNKPINK